MGRGAVRSSCGTASVFLGSVVLCGVQCSRLLQAGLQLPTGLRELWAARLRVEAADAAIKACFAPGLMLGSVVERPALLPGSWDTGRRQSPQHPCFVSRLSQGSPSRVSFLCTVGCDEGYEHLGGRRISEERGLASAAPLLGTRPFVGGVEGRGEAPGRQAGRQVGSSEWSGGAGSVCGRDHQGVLRSQSVGVGRDRPARPEPPVGTPWGQRIPRAELA